MLFHFAFRDLVSEATALVSVEGALENFNLDGFTKNRVETELLVAGARA